MFKWLSQKKASPEASPDASPEPSPSPAVESGEAASIIRRWDALIDEVRQRFRPVLEQAVAASEARLGDLEDFEPLSRIWSQAKAQLHQHTEQVSDAWNELSDRLSEAEPPEGVMWREGQKRDQATCELEIEHERAYRASMARAAEQLKQRGAVAFVGGGALFLGQRAAQGAWESMVRAETRIKGFREKAEVPLALLQELESTARSYWTTLFTVEAEHVPELRQYVAAKVESNMKAVEKTLRQYWRWRQRS